MRLSDGRVPSARSIHVGDVAPLQQPRVITHLFLKRSTQARFNISTRVGGPNKLTDSETAAGRI